LAIPACGAFHRSSPIGGEAKGMPLKDKIPVFPLIPLTIPVVVFTVAEIESDLFSFGRTAKEINPKKKHTGTIKFYFILSIQWITR
jgi:hypothetical protein